MAAVDPQGGQKYWKDGMIWSGLKTSQALGTQKFWADGLPLPALIPETLQPATRTGLGMRVPVKFS